MERCSLLMRSGVVLISLPARSERFGIRLAAAFGPKVFRNSAAFAWPSMSSSSWRSSSEGSQPVVVMSHQAESAQLLDEILACAA
ncbi:MAG: hypothetical protein V8Q54_11265 [Alistipes senegalensis]